jgi:hypothetical protein
MTPILVAEKVVVSSLRLFALHIPPPKPKYCIEARAKHIPDLLF